jgi:hypothetical protein
MYLYEPGNIRYKKKLYLRQCDHTKSHVPRDIDGSFQRYLSDNSPEIFHNFPRHHIDVKYSFSCIKYAKWNQRKSEVYICLYI